MLDWLHVINHHRHQFSPAAVVTSNNEVHRLEFSVFIPDSSLYQLCKIWDKHRKFHPCWYNLVQKNNNLFPFSAMEPSDNPEWCWWSWGLAGGCYSRQEDFITCIQSNLSIMTILTNMKNGVWQQVACNIGLTAELNLCYRQQATCMAAALVYMDHYSNL